MTSIKCPPPKIVAVKRSLKKSSKSNIMDDDDVKEKDDFTNDDDSLSSFDSRDLIEFEREELLIDLSEPPVVEKETIEDTISSKNARNSNTLLSLLDLLEIGNVMRTTEKELLGGCAEDDVSDRNPVVSKTSSSSSSRNIPSKRCACAASSGKTDKLSTVFPPLSIQPENPSIAKSFSRHSEDLNSEVKDTLKASEGSDIQGNRVSARVEEKTVIDSTLQKANLNQSEKAKENFISFSKSDCSIETCTCKTNKKSLLNDEDTDDSSNKETKENSDFCHFNHHQQLQHNQQHHNDVNTPIKAPLKVQETKVDKSDTNNNHESVSNQNSLDDSLSLSRVNRHEGGTNQLASIESLKFLSPHTSQRKLPPKFYSSTSSLNQDSFEASTRLKRLEERFKGFSYTKKLLRSSKVFSKSEEILSSYGKKFKFPEPLNSSFDHPLSCTTLSENCLRQLTAREEEKGGVHKDYPDRRTSSSNDISGELNFKG